MKVTAMLLILSMNLLPKWLEFWFSDNHGSLCASGKDNRQSRVRIKRLGMKEMLEILGGGGLTEVG